MHPMNQCASNSRQIAPCEPIVLPQLYRAFRTIQDEYRLASAANYAHVRRVVIVWINDYTQSVESEDCRYDSILTHFLSA